MSELKLDRPSGFWEAVGTHPLGIVGGALAGVLLGFVGGMAAGPVGSLLGAVVGGVAGGLLGASVETGPEIDLSEHDGFWREHYTERPYVHTGASYADYAPAYWYGAHARLRWPPPHDWQEADAALAAGWDAARGSSRLDWEAARPAARDAWERLSARVG